MSLAKPQTAISNRPSGRASDDTSTLARQPAQSPARQPGQAPARQPPARQPAQSPARLPAQDELPCSDGEPLESDRHVLAMMLLISSLKPWLRRRYEGSSEAGYVGGNMFLYFSPDEVKSRHFRGPDVFVALGVEPGERKNWVVWEEGNKAPDLVIELLSETTRKTDKEVKPLVYRDEVGVREYYWFDPFNSEDFAGFAFPDTGRASPGPDLEPEHEEASAVLVPDLEPDDDGRITSELLGLRLGTWEGCYEGVDAVWLRWYTPEGELLLTEDAERAAEEARLKEEEARRADEQARRADEQARLKEEEARRADKLAGKLRELGLDPDKIR